MEGVRSKNMLKASLDELVAKAKDDSFSTIICQEEVLEAQSLIGGKAFSKIDFFVLFTSINLLNAAIKKKQFKALLSYSVIKGNVSRLIHHLINIKFEKYDIDIYINPSERCAYIEMYNLQFSFHNININNKILNFMNSEQNKIKIWKGIRLQRIAGELFRLALDYKQNMILMNSNYLESRKANQI
jgi:hypothetical protein